MQSVAYPVKEVSFMSEIDSDRSDCRVQYGGQYHPVEDSSVIPVRQVDVLGGYSRLHHMVPGGGELVLNLAGLDRVGDALSQFTASDRRLVGEVVGAYLGDVLCSVYPEVLWESAGNESPVLRLSSKITWDVFAYVEANIEDSPDFLITGITEMQRLLGRTT